MEINGKYCFYGRRAIAIILVGHGLGLFGACLWSHANLRYLDIGMLLGSVFLLATGFCLWRNKTAADPVPMMRAFGYSRIIVINHRPHSAV